MWIIPNNLSISHSAQGMVELTWDSLELSQILSQSVMWRSKHSAASTWSKRLKRTSWLQHLSGRISKPSLGQSFVEEWISSQGGSLASHLAPQDSKRETETHDTSGPILSEGSKSLIDLPLFSWRMSWGSSAQSLKAKDGQTQQEHRFCCMSSESWRDWVIKQRLVYSQRLKQERHIRGNACLSWRVAPILASQDAQLFHQCSEAQAEKGQTWISPAAQAGKAREKLYDKDGEPWVGQGRAYRENGMHRTLTLPLQIQHTQHQEVKSSTHGNHQESRWATPETGSKNHMSSSHLYYKSRVQKKKQVSLNGQCVMIHRQKNQTLNPRWVESLMGLPIGWVMPSCVNPWTIVQMSSECLVMESCQPQQREHLESCGVDWKTPMADEGGGIMRYVKGSTGKYKLRDQVTWSNNGQP